ncbi:hypothetical protein C0993_006819 [Termitomyces sp. T159_Od127]|nr:hypothetical protein C0993_006819 [Termitomyces sp. T159_Od127]
MFDSSDDKDIPPTTGCKACNLTSTVLNDPGSLSLDSNHSRDALKSAETHPSMIKLLRELSSAALEISSDLSSTIAFSTTSLNPIVTELASLIDITASPTDTNIQVCPQTSAPSSISLSVIPALSKVLPTGLEISSAVSVAEDTAELPSSVPSMNDVKALSRSESCHLTADMDNFRKSRPAPFIVQGLSPVKADNPLGANSNSLHSEFPLGDLPKLGGKSDLAGLSNRSADETMASSPLTPLISMIELMDETIPLLQTARRIPWSQVSILLFLQIVGPLTAQVVSPFTFELIRGAIGPNIGTNEQLEYEGTIFGELEQRSMFYFIEASTVLFWSKASDKVGRKPVILIGLIGSSLSMICFGASQSFWGSILSCSLMNGLNGNDGVIKGMMAEIVDTTDLARIYAFVPLANSAGASIGPIINDFLSRPPSLGMSPVSTIEDTSIKTLNTFLYLFTCSVPVVLSITSFVLVYFFLKETVKSPARLSTLFEPQEVSDPEGHHESSLAHIVSALHIRPPELQDGLTVSGAAASVVVKKLPFNPTQLLSTRCLLMNPPVIISLGNFAFLSLIEIAYRSIQPLFLASPTSFGGLGLSAERTDNIVSVCEIINGIVQLMFFMKVHNHLGPKKSYMYGVTSAVPLFLMFPVMSILAKYVFKDVIIWTALGVQAVLFATFNLAFGEKW